MIKKNFLILYENHAQITVRCPVIPGINDNKEHFSAIHDLERKYPNLNGIEILPYHDFGKGKATSLSREYAIHAKTVSAKTIEKWKKEMVSCGCSESVIKSF